MTERLKETVGVEKERLKALRESRALVDGHDPDAMFGLYVVAIMKAFLPALAVGVVTQLASSDPVISTGAFLVTEIVGTFFHVQLGRWGASVAVAILENAERMDRNE